LAVHIRMKRIGRRNRPFYRIVAADHRRARDGKFLEVLGTYNPIAKPAEIKLFEERISKWLDEGAEPSDTVRTLFTQIGFTQKYLKGKKGEDVSTIEVKSTINERPKKTKKMKKAAVAEAKAEEGKTEETKAAQEAPAAEAKEEKPAETAPAETTAEIKAEEPAGEETAEVKADEPEETKEETKE
jgi:small subunit ribosomal protein S16